MLLKIEEARYLGNHRFAVEFSDGRSGTIEVHSLTDTVPVFAPLRGEDFVRGFELKCGTLCWPGELDIAPEYLYFRAFRDDPILHDRFVEWGYLPQSTHA